MKKTAIIIFGIILIPAMSGLLLAAEKALDGPIPYKEPQRESVELADRLEIESIARAQFSCDINSYRDNAAAQKNNAALLIRKDKF